MALTPRQTEIAALVSKGLTNAEIGGVLGIAAGTVKLHLSAIYKSLSVSNRTEVAGLWRASAQESPVEAGAARNGPLAIVLPLAAPSRDLEDRFFSQGVTDDLTTMLERMPGLFVIGRGTAQTFADVDARPSMLAEELRVNWVVDGTARRMGRRFRINLSLVEAPTSIAVWGDSWECPIDALTDDHDDVIREITATVATQIVLADAHRAGRIAPANMAAWDAYHRAIMAFYYRGVSAEAIDETLHLLDRTIEHDAGFAYAHGLRATVLSGRFVIGWSRDPIADAEAVRESGERALALAPEDPLVLQHWGYALSILENPTQSVPVLERSIELDPSNPQAHADLGYFLSMAGYAEEGENHIERAVALSPRDPRLYSWLGYSAVASIAQRDYEEADRRVTASIELFDRFPITLLCKAVLCRRLGRNEESESWGERVRALDDRVSFRSFGDWMDGIASAADSVRQRSAVLRPD